MEKYIVVCENFPQLPFHILSKFRESKPQIQKDNNVVFWEKNGKITYIGKQENIENTKSSIQSILHPEANFIDEDVIIPSEYVYKVLKFNKR